MTPLWGLAAAGSAGRSFFSRVPKLARQLGPVASTSYRLAARISNTLRAGTPVRKFADLQTSGFVVFCFPEGPLSSLANLEELDWTRKVILFCESPDDPLLETELRSRGAAVASIRTISALRNRFVISGDRTAVRFAQTVASSLHGHAVLVSREHLLLFESALTLSDSFFTPLLETAVECLRQAGMEQKEAAELSAALFQHSLRTFRHAGRKSWAGPVALSDDAAVSAQQQALASAKPMMGAYFRDAGRFSFELYQTFPELTRYDKQRWREFKKRYKPS